MFRRLFSRNREPREQTFWRWFVENSAIYARFQVGDANQNAILNNLGRKLAAVHGDLKFEIGVAPEGAERELIVSADGHRAAFPAVQALVAAAPAIPGWRITAFRQRKSFGETGLRIDGTEYLPAQLWFALRPETDLIGVDLYVGGETDPKSERALMVCFLMLDIALGEYDVETKVGTINTAPAPENPEARGLKPFRTFAEEFDALHALMHGGP